MKRLVYALKKLGVKFFSLHIARFLLHWGIFKQFSDGPFYFEWLRFSAFFQKQLLGNEIEASLIRNNCVLAQEKANWLFGYECLLS